MERLLGTDGTDSASAAHWLGLSAKIVVIKHGKEGSAAYTREGAYSVKPFPVAALKGFGGGDGYASAFLYGLMSGRNVPDSLELGSASAAMLVASHACSRDMPNERALMTFIREEKAKCGERVTRV